MTKRLLVALLVAMVVMGTVSTAFAAFSDVEGTKYENPVTVLTSLGLLQGFPDGTFKPGDTITRAQFAAVAVRALGLENAAEYSVGSTSFADVPATHWASGYINVASDQGLIKGYSDGTFKPEDPVKYSEALAIVVRMLGYEPMVKGTWPTGYLVKAAELGIGAGVTFASGAQATRGDVALFVDAALTIPMLVQVTAGDQVIYEPDDDVTLLGTRLGYETVTGYVTEVASLCDSNLNENEVKVDEELFDLAEGIDFADWLGMRVQAWHSGGEIVVAELLTSDDDIVTGTIDANTEDGTEFTIDDDDYDTATTWFMFANCVEINVGGIDAGDYADFDCVAVVDGDGDIVTLVATKFTDTLFLSSITTKYNKFEGIKSDATGFNKDLDTYDAYIILKNGLPADLDDLKVGDIAHYYETAGADCLYMEVYDENASGEVEAIETNADEEVVVTIDGEEYTMVPDESTYSVDDNDSFSGLDDEGDLIDFVGADATVYLDKDGNARHIGGDVEAAAAEELAGVIKTGLYSIDSGDPELGVQYFAKVFKTDGTSVRLEYDGDTVWTLLAGINTGADAGLFGFLNTGVVATNNAITWTAVEPELAGEAVSIELKDPSAASQALTIGVTDKAIVVNLATNAGSAITSTAAQVIAAVNTDAAASALLTAANTTGSSGAGVVAVVGHTHLDGASDLDIGTYVEYTLTSSDILDTVDEIKFTDPKGLVNQAFTEANVDADRNLLYTKRGTAATVIIDIGEWEVVPWATFETIEVTGTVTGANLFHNNDATADVFVFDSGTATAVAYGVTTEEIGIVTGRTITSAGTKIKVLVEDTVVSYLITDDTDVNALFENNWGTDTALATDLDVGDFVSFKYSGTDFVSITEWDAEDPFGAATESEGNVSDIDEDDLILTIVDDPEAATPDEQEYILDPEVLVYDVSDAPVLGDLSDLSDDALVQVINWDGGPIDVVKILKY